MKFTSTTLLLLASMGASSAFTVPAVKSGRVPLGMAKTDTDQSERTSVGAGFDTGLDEKQKAMEAGANQQKQKLRLKSESIPFMDVPNFLDGSMAGDVGFDPLGFADSEENLRSYREAEIKHARLAMLAAAGWPMSELFNRKIANVLSLDPVVDATNRVPSVLNGGLGKVSATYWISCVALAAAVELFTMFSASKQKDYFPGNLGFDLFGLYPTDKKGQQWMQTAEIKNGRLAMVAITGFAFQEFAMHTAVIDQSPFFFHPIWESLSNQVPGYIIPEDVVQEAATTAASSIDTVSGATAEVITAAPPVEAITVTPPVDAISAAPAAPSIDDLKSLASGSPISAPVEAAPALPVENISTIQPTTEVGSGVTAEEYAAAKRRIVELESRIAELSKLTN